MAGYKDIAKLVVCTCVFVSVKRQTPSDVIAYYCVHFMLRLEAKHARVVHVVSRWTSKFRQHNYEPDSKNI